MRWRSKWLWGRSALIPAYFRQSRWPAFPSPTSAAARPGNPYFPTATAAALRAAEMSCDALFKGTSVDGIYTADPKKVSDAKRYETLSFGKVLGGDLKAMDAAAGAPG